MEPEAGVRGACTYDLSRADESLLHGKGALTPPIRDQKDLRRRGIESALRAKNLCRGAELHRAFGSVKKERRVS